MLSGAALVDHKGGSEPVPRLLLLDFSDFNHTPCKLCFPENLYHCFTHAVGKAAQHRQQRLGVPDTRTLKAASTTFDMCRHILWGYYREKIGA